MNGWDELLETGFAVAKVTLEKNSSKSWIVSSTDTDTAKSNSVRPVQTRGRTIRPINVMFLYQITKWNR